MIRPATERDLPEVLSIERKSVTAPHWPEEEYRAMLGMEGVKRGFFVAEIAERVAGFAVGRMVGEHGEIESVVVGRETQRKGVGRALCETVMEWASVEGASAIELEVRVGSVGALALYKSLQFVETGRRKGYYREPLEDAIAMRRGL